MPARTDLPIKPFRSQAVWEKWLNAQHAISIGLWLKIAKSDSGIASVTYQEALAGALCYGWIDGQKGAFDEQFWLQRFTPRGPRSKWSQINCTKVSELIAAGRMKPAGLAEVTRAKEDGRWEAAYHPQSKIEVPPDLVAALDARPEARAFFATLKSANRYAILYRIQDAKRPDTRARRIEKFVAMLEAHETVHP